MIEYPEFQRVEMRVGRVLRVSPFPEARNPSYKLWIDFGDMGERKSSAQLTQNYSAEQLIGQLVIAVTNFPPRQIAHFMSEVLVLGVPDAKGDVTLLHPGSDVPLGGLVY